MCSGRLPRFKRSSNVPSIRLTERDRDILSYLHRHRFLRSEHLASLLPGSRQQTLRRLQLLYHHGYLERPRCQIDYFHRGGSHPIAYGIGNKGAGLLKRELSRPCQAVQWPKKGNVERLFLEHALLVADVMVAVELACRRRSEVRLLTTDELQLRVGATTGREPFQWQVDLGRGRVCGVIPDRVFGLELAHRPRGQNRMWFFVEGDRGTMPITRSRLDQTSVYRKLLAYEATWTQNLHRQLFGFHRFRVLIVTSSPSRLAVLIEACQKLQRGRGLFLFADQKSFRKADPLTYPWQSGRAGETGQLIVDLERASRR